MANLTVSPGVLVDGGTGIDSDLGNHFLLGHLNVRSLNTCFDELCNYICENSFDIFCLTETWLNSNYDSEYFNIPGYTFLRRDRDGRGGGVAIYTKKICLSRNLTSTQLMLILKVSVFRLN